MAAKKTEEQADTSELDLEALSKGLDDSIGVLQELLPLSKAKKGYEEEEDAEGETEEEDEEEDEQDEEEEEEHGGKMHKSLPELIAEDDPEAEVAMDVAPFLKSLAAGIQQYIDQEISPLTKSMKNVESLTKAQGKVFLAQAALSKAMGSRVEEIARTPVPSRSTLSKGGDRFAVESGGAAEHQLGYDPANKGIVLQKSHDLLLAGKIDNLQATKIAHRVNAGNPLPEDVAHLFADKA